MPATCIARAVCGLFVLIAVAPAVAQHDLPRRGMFGVQLAPVTEQNLGDTGLEKVTGALVTNVFPDTPAAAAGLQGGDVILRVDATDIHVLDDFMRKAQTYRAGDKVTLRVQRRSETLEIQFALAPRALETSPDFDVVYDALNVGDLRLRTILTRPKSGGKHPALLYVQNLGPLSIDWFAPQMQNPTRRLLSELTKQGIVTLRVELPGFGDSEGDRAAFAGFDAHVPNFAAAVRRLQQYDFVDPDRVFVFAERFGSLAAPLIAADARPAGVAVWSALGRPYITAQLDISRQHQELEAFSAAEIAKTLTELEAILKAIIVEGKSVKELADASPARAALLAQLAADGDTLLGRDVRFFRELAKLDPAKAWKRVACPVLVLRGACDYTSCAADARAIADAVNAAQSGRARLVELAGIDGMFGKATDMEEAYLAGSPGAFDPAAVDALVAWISGGKPGSGPQ